MIIEIHSDDDAVEAAESSTSHPSTLRRARRPSWPAQLASTSRRESWVRIIRDPCLTQTISSERPAPSTIRQPMPRPVAPQHCRDELLTGIAVLRTQVRVRVCSPMA